MDQDGNIEVVDGGLLFAKIPCKSVEVVHLFLKLFPHCLTSIVWHWDPNPNEVVNVSPAVREEGAWEFSHYFYFGDSKEDGGVGGAWGLAHGSATNFFPEGISKSEDIVLHHNFQSRNKRVDWDAREVSSVPAKLSCDDGEGGLGVYVGIHGYRIGSEEARIFWKLEWFKVVFEISRVFNICWHCSSYLV